MGPGWFGEGVPVLIRSLARGGGSRVEELGRQRGIPVATEVEDDDDRWAPVINERERGEEGAGELGRVLGRDCYGAAGPAHAGEGREGNEGVGCYGPKGGRGRE